MHSSAAFTTTSDDLKPWFPGVPASSYRAMPPFVTPTPVFFSGELSDEKHHHFLDSCFLCKNRLAGGRDIFMYRGDTPFCSEECRQEQIDIDEALEKLMLSSSRKKQHHKTVSESPPVSTEVQFRAAGAAVAGYYILMKSLGATALMGTTRDYLYKPSNGDVEGPLIGLPRNLWEQLHSWGRRFFAWAPMVPRGSRIKRQWRPGRKPCVGGYLSPCLVDFRLETGEDIDTSLINQALSLT